MGSPETGCIFCVETRIIMKCFRKPFSRDQLTEINSPIHFNRGEEEPRSRFCRVRAGHRAVSLNLRTIALTLKALPTNKVSFFCSATSPTFLSNFTILLWHGQSVQSFYNLFIKHVAATVSHKTKVSSATSSIMEACCLVWRPPIWKQYRINIKLNNNTQ